MDFLSFGTKVHPILPGSYLGGVNGNLIYEITQKSNNLYSLKENL